MTELGLEPRTLLSSYSISIIAKMLNECVVRDWMKGVQSFRMSPQGHGVLADVRIKLRGCSSNKLFTFKPPCFHFCCFFPLEHPALPGFQNPIQRSMQCHLPCEWYIILVSFRCFTLHYICFCYMSQPQSDGAYIFYIYPFQYTNKETKFRKPILNWNPHSLIERKILGNLGF